MIENLIILMLNYVFYQWPIADGWKLLMLMNLYLPVIRDNTVLVQVLYYKVTFWIQVLYNVQVLRTRLSSDLTQLQYCTCLLVLVPVGEILHTTCTSTTCTSMRESTWYSRRFHSMADDKKSMTHDTPSTWYQVPVQVRVHSKRMYTEVYVTLSYVYSLLLSSY